MKKLKNLLLIALLFTASAILGQAKISGKVLDETGEPLPGANIIEKGTTNGTATDFDGNFMLNTKSDLGAILISFIGYQSKEIPFKGDTNLGSVALKVDLGVALDEIVIMGVIDVAKDRETPVAVSTIKAAEIQDKLGSQEFPEILKATPSVYATKRGGGFGDSRVVIRGFQQENIAVMINGVPVNDMENSRVYWSNWAGLSDVTSAMQVQRGLGSSKLAISSVGGTINVITKTSQQKEGGNVTASFGNDSYMKFLAAYSTGKLENGLSASILLSRTQGDGYVHGTKFLGHNFFIGLGYEINEKNQLEFTFTGAPQWHHQRSYAPRLSDYIKYGKDGEPDIKYNSDWGYLQGKEFSWRRNFYHKPVMSLNWDWKINDKSNLATIVYASWGRGGGSGPIGGYTYPNPKDPKRPNFYEHYRIPKTDKGTVDFDFIQRFNQGKESINYKGNIFNAKANNINSRKNAGFTRRASINSHNWYGTVINFHNDASENLSWDLGVDLRTYTGIHYRVVTDLLGAKGYSDSRDKNNPNRSITEYVEPSPSFNPWASITDQQKIEYYNDGNVSWYGGFGQVEYKTEKISTFIQAGVSNQGFQRIDYFNLTPDKQKSEYKYLFGGNVKGGINFNINEESNLFANVGYYSKQPNFRAVYRNYTNNDVTPGLKNENILGVELGYGFKNEFFDAKLNAYRTSWKNRFSRSRAERDGSYYNFEGIEQVHQGIEIEAVLKPSEKVNVNAMLSFGSFEYGSNVTGKPYNEDGSPKNVSGDDKKYYLKGLKVGDVAQTTMRLGFDYEILKGLKLDNSVFVVDRLYSSFTPEKITSEEKAKNNAALRLPAYVLADVGLSYKFNISDNMGLNLRLNVNNLTDKVYISESNSNNKSNPGDKTWNGINTSNNVFFGYGRTWNASVRFNF